MEIGNAITALKSGFSLRNPAVWNNSAETSRAIAGLLTVVIAAAHSYGVDFHVDDQTLMYIGLGVWGTVGMFKSYTKVATNPDLGVVPSLGNSNAPDDRRGGA